MMHYSMVGLDLRFQIDFYISAMAITVTKICCKNLMVRRFNSVPAVFKFEN
jgi:hypothetical protein